MIALTEGRRCMNFSFWKVKSRNNIEWFNCILISTLLNKPFWRFRYLKNYEKTDCGENPNNNINPKNITEPMKTDAYNRKWKWIKSIQKLRYYWFIICAHQIKKPIVANTIFNHTKTNQHKRKQTNPIVWYE